MRLSNQTEFSLVFDLASCELISHGEGTEYIYKGPLTTKTSLSVKVGFQSLLSVSTQTDPVASSTFGCHMRVLKDALGGLFG